MTEMDTDFMLKTLDHIKVFEDGRGAYIEVISYDKLVRDAKQRNQILFDKLFNPKVNEVLNSKLLNE